VVEGESLVRREQLRPGDDVHPAYGARSLRVQTTTPAGGLVIVPIFVPTTADMFISAAMSRIRCVMIPSNTTARVCFLAFRVSTSSRTGTSVTTPSPSSRRRAVEEPPSCRSMSRYFSNFGFRALVVGVRGAGGASRTSRGSGLDSGRGSPPRSNRPGAGAGPAFFASGNSVSGLYTWPLSPYISTYWSAGILFRRAFMICFCVSSSTSFPRGARAMKSTSATCRSSFRIRSPPRSPSTNAVKARSFDSSWTVFGTFVPSAALDDLVALRDADVLDFLHLDRRLAGADAVDRLECRGQDRRLDLVQRGRDVDESLGPSLLALHVHFDSTDAPAFLQVAQVELFAEEPLGLAENGPDHVGLLHDPFGLHSGLDHVFSRTWIDVHVPCLPGSGRSRLPFHRSRRCCPAGPFGLLGKEAGKRDPDEWDG